MTETSTIKYDQDHPHEMKMVWDEWKKKQLTITEVMLQEMYDLWIVGRSELIIDQAVWTRIVATYL